MGRVKIVSEGTGMTTHVIDEETGAELKNVLAVDIRITP